MLTLPYVFGPVGYLVAALPVLLPVMCLFKKIVGRYPEDGELAAVCIVGFLVVLTILHLTGLIS